jgi:hypothetical protein
MPIPKVRETKMLAQGLAAYVRCHRQPRLDLPPRSQITESDDARARARQALPRRRPVRQPSTYNLLGGYFSKEDINCLFGGAPTKRQSEEAKALAEKFLDVSFDIKSDAAAIEAVRKEFPAPRSAAVENDTNNASIRFDLKFPADGPDCPFEMWFDHAIVQETSETYADDLLAFLRGGEGRFESGPAFRKMQQKKKNKYAALIATVERLHAAQARFSARLSVPNHHLSRLSQL